MAEYKRVVLACAPSCPFEKECYRTITKGSYTIACIRGIGQTFDINENLDLSGGERMDNKLGIIISQMGETPDGHSKSKEVGFVEDTGGIAWKLTTSSQS